MPIYRWVDEKWWMKDFFGVYTVAKTDATTLVSFIKDVLCRLGLKIEDCRGQCYNVAAVMSGAKSGVATALMKV